MRRLVLLLLALLLAVAFAGVRPGAAWAQDGEPEIREEDNLALAINLEDDSELFDFAFEIRRVAGDVVDNENAAIAFNQCERCRSVAVAIQIVLVVSDPSVVTPENAAVAVNYQCTLCESLAMAYQFVIGVPADFRFSGEAMSEIKRIRNEIRRLMRSDLPIPELRARIDALADRLRQVLRDDIARHEERKRRANEGEGRSPPPPPPATTTTETTQTEPAETTPTDTGETETTETDTTQTETTETGTETTVTETTTVP